MDLSSNTIKEYMLDSNIFNQRRCEFKMPSDYDVLSNLKLLNVGAVGSVPSSAYNRGAGVLGLINRISLMDGAQVLSECKDVNKQLTFKNLNTSNNHNNSYKTPIGLSASNYQYGTLDASGADTVAKQYSAPGYLDSVMTNSESTTFKGMLQLSDVLPLLNNIEMLDSSVFKNGLRLVIEWEKDVYKVSTDKTNTFTVLEPVLSMYQVIDPSLKNELKIKSGVVSWYEREVDNRNYAAIASPQSQKFNGFDNKRVLRFYVQKEFQTATNYDGSGDSIKGLGKCGSVALIDESFNVINNGRQIFPTNLTKADIGRQLVNAYGSFVGFVGFDQMPSAADTQFPNFEQLHFSQSIRTGDLGFYGVQLNNEMVKQFELVLSRSITVAGTGSNDSIKVSIYADVAKTMSVGPDGSYVVGYA